MENVEFFFLGGVVSAGREALVPPFFSVLRCLPTLLPVLLASLTEAGSA